ncbi:MAG: ribonuclease III [Clostridiales bacterium]|nr:ribonuclease III [Clostridiales bacterium]
MGKRRSVDSRDIRKLLRTIGYDFKDISLLKNALTHSSYSSEHRLSYSSNNERLEFIGDAYVDAAVGAELFRIMKDAPEGVLSKNRADVVREESLAEVARDIGLGDYIYMGRGEEITGGRNKDSILADSFEALIGAIITDGGYEAGRRVILELLGDKIELAVEGRLRQDYKSMLQEKLQEKVHSTRMKYVTIAEKGPDHDKTFTVEVRVGNKILGRGTGKSKSKAEQAAASDALSKGEL